MSVLVVLWVGTLGIIFASSYFEMSVKNEQMLKKHAEMFVLSETVEDVRPPAMPFPGNAPGSDPDFADSPMFQLSTFYTVAVSYDGEILEIRNEQPTVHTDEALELLAQEILREGRGNGTKDNVAFYKTDKGGYLLVAFKDNTVLNESAMTLFRYTLIFGGGALIVFFFLAVFLAKKIVDPLEQSYSKQKQFISDAGHELKTPVSVVCANAELLSREIGDNRWLANIQYENERMGLLVGQLLELARTENVTPVTERVNFSRLVAGESLPFESVAFEKELELACDITDGIFVDGNSAQLKQLVSILLDNAIRHSKNHGTVRLLLIKEHSRVKLSVINDGDAIPKEHRERIFERFYRSDAARSGEDGHYGLGLAIAKAIADSHKGSIGVRCYDGRVEFCVQLPAVSQ